MKEFVLELIRKKHGFNVKLNTMREYLQAYVLRVMYEEGVFRAAAFIGDTALRFLYGLPRFSEDLDFSALDKSRIDFLKLIKKIENELILAGYDISVSYNDRETVNSGFIKFEHLMYEGGLSPLKSQKFSVKLEIDTKPPAGAALKTYIVNKYFPIAFLSYDRESLFAGKLGALLGRKYTKGRDFFDLGWYLSKWPGLSPNIVLLNNALKQTGWNNEFISRDSWRDFIYRVVQKADWEKVEKDLGSFLENPGDIKIFSKENILGLIRS